MKAVNIDNSCCTYLELFRAQDNKQLLSFNDLRNGDFVFVNKYEYEDEHKIAHVEEGVLFIVINAAKLHTMDAFQKFDLDIIDEENEDFSYMKNYTDDVFKQQIED